MVKVSTLWLKENEAKKQRAGKNLLDRLENKK